MHTNLCKNCEHTFLGNFCYNCGQKTNTQRLNWHYIYDELKYTFLHINGGFLYTAKQLFTRPGFMIKEFLEGKRIKHYKPILMVFVLAGINGLLLHCINVEDFMPQTDNKNPEIYKKILEWITSHYAIVELAFIPIISLASWLTFRKWGYNYIENIIINSFASSQRLLVGIVTFPILLLFEKYSLSAKTWISIPEYLITIWVYWQLYNDKKSLAKFFKILQFILFIAIAFLLVVVAATCAYLAFVNVKMA